MVIRKGKVKLNLSILFDFAQGHCFVAVFSWDFCHDKILSSEGFLQISTWAKNLIMDKTPRVFIVVEFCCGGLRPESSLFFSCCNLFLGIMISWEIGLLEGQMVSLPLQAYHIRVLVCWGFWLFSFKFSANLQGNFMILQ